MVLAVWLTLAGCLAASFFDVRTRRIPNALTGSLALSAVIVHAFEGWQSLGTSVAVMLFLMLAGALIYSRGGIGAGDIKLAVSGSGMLSYPLCVPFLLYTAICGGLVAVIFLLARANGRATLSRAVYMTLAGSPGIATDKRDKLPYAVAFALGAILVALSQNVAPFLRINF